MINIPETFGAMRSTYCALRAGMATGESGDVLTGVIAGLIAQGFELQDAAETGVCVHAAAGDLAVRDGERGMIASDLFPPNTSCVLT